MAGFEHVGVGGHVGEARLLVYRQPQPVAHRVHVTDLGFGVAGDGGMPPTLEELAGHLLVAPRLGSHLVGLNDALLTLVHVSIGLLDLRRCVAQAEGAGHVEEIAAAGFAGEDVEDDGLTQRDHVVGAALAVGDARVAPDGEDEAFRVLQSLLGQKPVDLLVHSPDGQGSAVGLHQHLVLHPMRLEKLDGASYDRAGAPPHLLDTFGFGEVFGGAGGVNQRHVEVAVNLDALQLRIQCIEQHPGTAPILQPVETHPPAHAQVGENAAVQFDGRGQLVACLAEDAHEVVSAQVDDGETAGSSLLPLHRPAEEHGLFAPLLEHEAAGQPCTVGHVVHRRIAVHGTSDKGCVQSPLFHQAIQVLFHR